MCGLPGRVSETMPLGGNAVFCFWEMRGMEKRPAADSAKQPDIRASPVAPSVLTVLRGGVHVLTAALSGGERLTLCSFPEKMARSVPFGTFLPSCSRDCSPQTVYPVAGMLEPAPCLFLPHSAAGAPGAAESPKRLQHRQVGRCCNRRKEVIRHGFLLVADEKSNVVKGPTVCVGRCPPAPVRAPV